MTEKRLKLARTFSSRHELAEFLRELADRLEGQDVEEFDVLDPDALARFQVGVKNRQGEYLLKFRAKAQRPEALCPEGGTCVAPAEDSSAGRVAPKTPGGHGREDGRSAEMPPPDTGADEKRRPSYSRLKKRMKAQYRDITRSLQDHRLPEPDVVDAFMADSARMVTYPGKGDEYYPAYTAACQGFAQALAAGDAGLAAERWDAVRLLMRDCHDRYK